MAYFKPTPQELVDQLNANVIIIESAAARIEDILETCPARLRSLILRRVDLDHEMLGQAELDLQPEVSLEHQG